MSTVFFIKRNEDLDTFINRFMAENKCCDKAEITEINDSWKVEFIEKEIKKMAEEKPIQAAQAEKPKGIRGVMDIFSNGLSQEIENQIRSVIESSNEAKKQIEREAAEFKQKAQEKLDAMEKTINEKLQAHAKDAERKIAEAKKAAEDKAKQLDDRVKKLEDKIENAKKALS